MTDAKITLGDMCASLTARLRALERKNYVMEVRWLLAAVAGPDYWMAATQPATAEQQKALTTMADRLAQGEPFGYVLGSQSFYGLELLVDQRVLTPRPETELLVEQALQQIHGRPLRVLDLCCGSGAIGLTLAKLSPATVIATELEQDALDVARENDRRLHTNVTFYQGDLFAALPPDTPPFDLICSNPPYLTTAELADAPRELSFEPRSALDGGADGLTVIRRILTDAKAWLTDNGCLLMEIGAGQGNAVCTMSIRCGFPKAKILTDLAGHDRLLFTPCNS